MHLLHALPGEQPSSEHDHEDAMVGGCECVKCKQMCVKCCGDVLGEVGTRCHSCSMQSSGWEEGQGSMVDVDCRVCHSALRCVLLQSACAS